MTDRRVAPACSRRRCAAKARTRPARPSASLSAPASSPTGIPRASTSVTDPPPTAAHGASTWAARALGDANARPTPNALSRSMRSKDWRTPKRPRGGSAGCAAASAVRDEACSTCAALRAAAEATIAGVGAGRSVGAAGAVLGAAARGPGPSGTVDTDGLPGAEPGPGVGAEPGPGVGAEPEAVPPEAEVPRAEARPPTGAADAASMGAASAAPGRRTMIVEVARRPSRVRATRSARRRRSPRRVSMSAAASGVAHVVWSISVRGARATVARRRAAGSSVGRGVPTQ